MCPFALNRLGGTKVRSQEKQSYPLSPDSAVTKGNWMLPTFEARNTNSPEG
ncbi:hypothetical protein Mic7113_6359 [Allocoleopsis franciscana PCC 7113]|uniref:Uncharacterized protein n=1 Tax=Allocoleopsis franciscana PCC 7113 TaxID=1173027 RepID=K9WQ67_9CYAN|nr:hypothetical protein Mic7113_6359 [Allocoleopsis franciscana PCC 7113]